MGTGNGRLGGAHGRAAQAAPVVYAKHILVMLLVIAPVASLQAHYYYGGFDLHFFFAPLFVSLVIGALLGRTALLKERLSRQGENFRAIADLAQEFTYYRRVDGQYEYVSPASLAMTGYSPRDFYDTPDLMNLLIHPDDHSRWMTHVHTINDGGEPVNLEVRLVARDGRIVWFQHVCAPVYDEQGKQIGVRSTNLDVTRQKEGEERIEHMAYYDLLTGLPNRRSLVNRIEQQIHTAAGAARPFALLFLDIHRFKHINDSFGHNFGDRLLQEVATRLGQVCGDACVVSRFGGDEFVILMPGASSKALVREMANALLAAVEQPLELDGMDLHVSACVGISLYPEDGTDGDTLIRNADVAMFQSKRDSASNIRFYSSAFSDEAVHFVSTEGKVQRGIANGEFVTFYQPKVDIRSGDIIGLEALARWRHPQLGMISPAEFIPVAEETGQIKALGSQILDQVLSDISHWQRLGVALPVAINVSARQFADHDYCHDLLATIDASPCALSLVELEITEQVFLGDIDSAIRRLHKLRAAGLSIALDDFGTGYSSFNYIKELPIDTLKIDRAFITHIDSNRAEYAIIKALVSLCRDLDLDMVVEGVESALQREALLELGCERAQGFYFYKPLSADKVTVMLQQQAGVGTAAR